MSPTVSFLLMVLLWDRERLILKKESFFVAEEGGDEVLESRPSLDTGRGGEDIAWSRPQDRLSLLGEELTVLKVCPIGIHKKVSVCDKKDENLSFKDWK